MRRTLYPLLQPKVTSITPSPARATFRSISQSQQSLRDVAPADPTKEPSESIRKAKDEGGATPAHQQAKVVKDQMPAKDGSAQTQPDLSYAKTVNIGVKDGGKEGGEQEKKLDQRGRFDGSGYG